MTMNIIDRLEPKNRIDYATEKFVFSYFTNFIGRIKFFNVAVVDKKHPDTLLHHETCDKPVSYSALKKFAERFEKEWETKNADD